VLIRLRVLQRFDRDNDGKITWGELYAAVRGGGGVGGSMNAGNSSGGLGSAQLRTSFALLDQFQSSGLPLSPQLNLLLEVAREQGQGGNATAVLAQVRSTLFCAFCCCVSTFFWILARTRKVMCV